MIIDPDISAVSIVLVGSFNPPIFNPDWFARHNLFSPKESENAQVKVGHRQISSFDTEWLELQVTTDRFQASTHQEPYRRLCDLVVRTFAEFLSHTPLHALGINRDVHFKVESFEVRDRIGYKLAPPDVWGEWSAKIKSGKGDRHGGMVSLVMQQKDTDDRPSGYIQAAVQPSQVISNNSGIYVQINDHYQLQPTERPQGADQIIALLEQRFWPSIERSEWIVNQVMRLKDE